MKTQRGFTLIELLVAATIMLVAVALAGALLVAGVNLTHSANQRGDEADATRLAMDDIVKAVQNAANGAPQGVWIGVGGTTPTLLSAISGVNGTDGVGTTSLTCPDTGAAAAITPSIDDLWLVVPDKNAMRESCKDLGAATTIMAAGTGAISVGCIESFADGDMLLATNMNTAALLTNIKRTAESGKTPGTIDYKESGIGLSDSPEHNGYQIGDMVYRASLVHYFVRNDPNGLKDVYGNPVPVLFKAAGALSGSAPAGYPSGGFPQAGRPFYDSTPVTRIQNYVDDLQIAYGFDSTGTGNPANFVWKNGLAPTICSGSGTSPTNLRAVRITIEIRGSDKVLSNKGNIVLSADTQHQIIEDNYTTATQPAPDGYRRVLYSRTIELPNLAPGSL